MALRITDLIFEFQGKNYQFNSDIDEPLRYILKIDDDRYIIRDIDCDEPIEHWRLVRRHVGVMNSQPHENILTKTVYWGQEIDSALFLNELLKHIFNGFIINN